MKKEKQTVKIVNHYEKDSNCQIYNGNITNSVFAMPGTYVNLQAAPVQPDHVDKPDKPADKKDDRDEPLTLFVHPSVDSAMEWQIHHEIKRLVARHGLQEICQYLLLLRDERKVLLPQNAEKAYNELVRLGMPQGEGYSIKTFMKYYKR